MKTKTVVKMACMAAALSLTLPIAGRSEESPISKSSFSIGPRASFYKAQDADEGQWYAGAQARLHLGDAMALEGSVDYRREIYADNTPAETRVKVYPVQATLLGYLIPSSPVSPYLLGGAGWYYTRVEAPLGYRNTQNRFGLHAGAGLEAKFNSSLSLDGSYRYTWVEDVNSKDENVLDKNYSDRGHQVTVSLNIHF